MVIIGLAVGIGRVSVGEISSNQMKCNLDGGQTRGEMFYGNWSKHLSPAKEMSGPVSLI